MCEAWLRLLPTATCVKLRAEALSTVQHVSSWGLKLYPQCSTCNWIFKLSTVQHVWICEGWSSVHGGAVRAEALPMVELWGLKLYPLWSCEGWSSIHCGAVRAEALSTEGLWGLKLYPLWSCVGQSSPQCNRAEVLSKMHTLCVSVK